MSEYRSIIMRSNRLLGAALVEHNLITVEQLDAANERLLLAMDKGSPREICLLNILLNITKVLSEDALLDHAIDDLALALLDLREIDINDDVKIRLKPGVCWATWTVPFDRDEDIHYVASAYHLSAAVKQYWEKELGTPIIWFCATLDSVADFLEKLEAERNGSAVGFSPATEGAA